MIRVRPHPTVLLNVLLPSFGDRNRSFLLSRLVSVADGLWLLQSLLWCVAVGAVPRFARNVVEWWNKITIVTDKRAELKDHNTASMKVEANSSWRADDNEGMRHP